MASIELNKGARICHPEKRQRSAARSRAVDRSEFCLEAVEEALARHDKPEIFNTDQGSQFTSQDFTGLLLDNAIAISMDGRGAWRDNVFVERLWRSVKYEEVYLRAYDSLGEARASIGRYLDFYNPASQHPSVYVIEENRFC
jgi:putative transposase